MTANSDIPSQDSNISQITYSTNEFKHPRECVGRQDDKTDVLGQAWYCDNSLEKERERERERAMESTDLGTGDML
jgi:hypothetical protein